MKNTETITATTTVAFLANFCLWHLLHNTGQFRSGRGAVQRLIVRHNYVGSGQGTVIRITEFAPGAPKFMHRTETVDYAIRGATSKQYSVAKEFYLPGKLKSEGFP